MSWFEFFIPDIKPAFIQPPEDTTVTEGMTAVLTCEVSGAPRPAISWKRGSQLLMCRRAVIHIFLSIPTEILQIHSVPLSPFPWRREQRVHHKLLAWAGCNTLGELELQSLIPALPDTNHAAPPVCFRRADLSQWLGADSSLRSPRVWRAPDNARVPAGCWQLHLLCSQL